MKIKSCKGCDERKIFDYGDISITWSIIDECNLSCVYCPCKYKQIQDKYIDINKYKYKKILEFINFVNKYKKVSLQLYGGEPTIAPFFMKMMDKLDKIYNISIVTNTTFNFNFIDKLNLYGYDLIFRCSYHKSVDPELYYNNIKYIIKNKKNLVECRIMLKHYDTNYLSILELRKKLEKLVKINDNIEIIYSPIIEYNSCKIDKNILKLLDKSNSQKLKIEYCNSPGIFEIINTRKDRDNNFKFYRCYCGQKNLVIDPKGNVFYCKTHREFQQQNNIKKSICNVEDDYKELIKDVITKPIICDQEICRNHPHILREKVLFNKKEI